MDLDPTARLVEDNYRQRGVPLQFRSRDEVERLFDGLTLADPGLRLVHHWRPDGTAEGLSDAEVSVYGGVARK
ncbi:conserved hypothetical protein [Parafrankia sp. EAN1pec]|nr:conserved hypothetical protein [Frankia sp. EAN1pec]